MFTRCCATGLSKTKIKYFLHFHFWSEVADKEPKARMSFVRKMRFLNKPSLNVKRRRYKMVGIEH